MKKKTYAALERELYELQSSTVQSLCTAIGQIMTAGAARYTASGVILTLTAPGGAEIIPPVMIRDGLSDDTIAAIRRDIIRSISLERNVAIKVPGSSRE